MRWIERAGLTEERSRVAFDRVTRLVQRLLGVPVALVTTITRDTQVFSGRTGIDLDETPVSHALCSFVVRDDAPLVLPDTHEDVLSCDHPAVRELRVRAYIGVPFHAPDGTPLGSLCAIDLVPHAWTAEDLETMLDLVEIVNAEIALRLERAECDDKTALLHRHNVRMDHDFREGEAALGVSSDALHEANATLGRINAELIRQHDELRAFTSLLSHDLAEPVRKIRTFASLLRPALPEPEDRLHLSRVEGLAGQMHEQLRALAAYAEVSLTTGQTAHGPVDLAALVPVWAAPFVGDDVQIVATPNRRSAQQNGERGAKGLPVVTGNADLLARFFAELFDNAVRYRRADAPLKVVVSAETRTDGDGALWHELHIDDTGQGFEPRHAERIFRPFERLHHFDERGGSGLGLTLCRRIAERHGGTLTADSAPGTGATFVLRLPAHGPRAS